MLTRRTATFAILAVLAGCGQAPGSIGFGPRTVEDKSPLNTGETPELRAKINTWAAAYDIPPSLLHRVIQRESGYNPDARNGRYYGLMQIAVATARGIGFEGEASELLDPDVNLEFGGKYLRGAWIVARGDQDAAIRWYARGYYYEAKRLGLLVETGLVAS